MPSYRRRGKAKKKHENENIGIQEPVRKSLLDIVEANFAAVNRVTYLNRITIVGEHHFDVAHISIENLFQQIIEEVNLECIDEKLTGLLLYYPKHFCHLTEGSEYSIYKLLDNLFFSENYSKYFSNCKVLDIMHHLKQRLTFDWYTYTAIPPKMVEKLDPDAPYSVLRVIVYNAIIKMYILTSTIHGEKEKEKKLKEVGERDLEETFSFAKMMDGVESIMTTSSEYTKSEKRRSAFMSGMVQASYDRHRDHLLEIGRIEVLLQTKYIRSLESFLLARNDVPTADFYRDATWPIETDFIPYNVFDKQHEPIMDLPTAKKEETADIVDTESVTAASRGSESQV